MPNRKSAVLFLSLDGLMEPLGQSQVLAYLEKLSEAYVFRIISFEKEADWADLERFQMMRDRLQKAGIGWHPMRYWPSRTLIGPLWNVLRGVAKCIALTIRYRVVIIHARSYLPAMIALPTILLTRTRYLFDIRGFWADERLDSGVWRKLGMFYRLTKWIECRLYRRADHVVTLTKASVPIIQQFDYAENDAPPITVIPTCADLERFRPRASYSADPFILGHVGNVAGWYLFEETLHCFLRIKQKRPNARLHVINRGAHAYVSQMLQRFAISNEDVLLQSASFEEMPELISTFSAGAGVIKPTYSKQASFPTKMAEYLGCGIPMYGNAGVGDVAEIVENERVGVALHAFTDEERDRCVTELLQLSSEPDISQRCRAAAEQYFSLKEGAKRYDAVYRSLLSHY